MVSKKNLRLWEKSDLWSKKPQFHGNNGNGKSPKRVLEKREIYPISQTIGIKELSIEGSPNFFVSSPVEKNDFFKDYQIICYYYTNPGPAFSSGLFCFIQYGSLYVPFGYFRDSVAVQTFAYFKSQIVNTFRLSGIIRVASFGEIEDYCTNLGLNYYDISKSVAINDFNTSANWVNKWLQYWFNGVNQNPSYDLGQYFENIKEKESGSSYTYTITGDQKPLLEQRYFEGHYLSFFAALSIYVPNRYNIDTTYSELLWQVEPSSAYSAIILYQSGSSDPGVQRFNEQIQDIPVVGPLANYNRVASLKRNKYAYDLSGKVLYDNLYYQSPDLQKIQQTMKKLYPDQRWYIYGEPKGKTITSSYIQEIGIDQIIKNLIFIFGSGLVYKWLAQYGEDYLRKKYGALRK